MNLTEIEKQLEMIGNGVGRLQGECSLLKDQLNTCQNKINDYEHAKEINNKAVQLLTLVQAVTRDKTKKQFESLVTHALQFISDRKYVFNLIFSTRGNLQEMEFGITTEESDEVGKIEDSEGGGAIDIVSLALRLILLETTTPKNKGFIVFDESFKHLSSNFRPRASQFLKDMSKKSNRQIIHITHASEFIENSDKVIEIK